MEGSYDREFWQFTDQLRLQTTGLSALSLGDSIWSPATDRPARNDAGAGIFGASPATTDALPSSFKTTNTTTTTGNYDNISRGGGGPGLIGSGKLAFGATKHDRSNNNSNSTNLYGAADKNNNFNFGGNNTGGTYAKNNNHNNSFGFNKMGNYPYNSNTNSGGQVKSYFNKSAGRPANNNSHHHHQSHKKGAGGEYGKNKKQGGGNTKSGNDSSSNGGTGTAADKRFKTLPAAEALPRGEPVGGYIFVCNNDTMDENLRRELFGLPSRYRDSVRAIRPGLPLFLYNYSTHQLHGIFEAASFGGTNIDPTAWEDKKCPGESRFPAQVRVATRKIYEPLEEDAFRPILHHYDGPKFRLELSVTEALALLDIFADKQDA